VTSAAGNEKVSLFMDPSATHSFNFFWTSMVYCVIVRSELAATFDPISALDDRIKQMETKNLSY